VDTLKQSLINDFKIPEEQIAVATGEIRGIEEVNLFDPDCPIRFIITVRALAEGWDCSFAYVLCSVSEISTPRSVEQILGRILRLPQARRKRRPELNCAYAFAASPNFIHTAQTLTDALIEGAGFQTLEASDLIVQAQAPSLWDRGLFVQSSETLQGVPNLKNLPPELAPRVSFDPGSSTLTVRGPISESQVPVLKAICTNLLDLAAIERIAQNNSGLARVQSSVSNLPPLTVPQLAIRIDDQLELFEDQFLDTPWNLAESNPFLSETEFSSDYETGASGSIDITDSGRVEMTDFVRNLHRQLDLIEHETGWTLPQLAVWLDRRIPHPDIPQSQSGLFMHKVLSSLMEQRNLGIEHLARHKFRLAKSIETKIDSLRSGHNRSAFDALLLNPDTPWEVGPELCLTFDADAYAPNWYYDGNYRFTKHLYPLIGELKSDGEEFQCAVHLDTSERVEVWVRNLERRPESSFWLQTSTDRFYPDFVARLTDGRILVVEYKGADRWSTDDSEEKRAIGDLWAARGNGRCTFIMPNGPDWPALAAAINV
jgi:type III restriction enzyme